jgi:hypothetical protein
MKNGPHIPIGTTVIIETSTHADIRNGQEGTVTDVFPGEGYGVLVSAPFSVIRASITTRLEERTVFAKSVRVKHGIFDKP